MKTWEYMILEPNADGDPDSKVDLDELGKDGWELITVKPGFIQATSNDTAPYETDFWYFKRPLEPAPANIKLVHAAKEVVSALDDHGEWGDLKEAIARLSYVLENPA